MPQPLEMLHHPMFKAILCSQIVMLGAFSASGAFAAGTLDYNGDRVALPPASQRQIVGTWLKDVLMGHRCTRSIEGVNSKFYEVIRCDDGDGGKYGEPLRRTRANTFYRIDNSAGDYYVILKNGDLELRDRDGRIGIEPSYGALWPAKPTVRHN